MDDDALLPRWARDKRMFMNMSTVIGAALAIVLIVAALTAPDILRSMVEVLSSLPLLISLVVVALCIGGLRRIIVGPAGQQDVPPSVLPVTYFLGALPIGFAALALGAVVTISLVFNWQPRFDLVQSFLLLIFGFVVLSITMKIYVNAQMLKRHWFDR